MRLPLFLHDSGINYLFFFNQADFATLRQTTEIHVTHQIIFASFQHLAARHNHGSGHEMFGHEDKLLHAVITAAVSEKEETRIVCRLDAFNHGAVCAIGDFCADG